MLFHKEAVSSPRVLRQRFLAAPLLIATAAPLLGDSQKLVNPRNNHSYQRIVTESQCVRAQAS
ncbi:MAG: hypothetical protein L6R30_24095 [Thermoanaerobaculia bacterium]|nr:hypothetical protein [Thermoanaerobaculia bacterium]